MNNAQRPHEALSSLELTLSWFFWPIPLASMVIFGFKCFKEKKFLDALPLLASQAVSFLIWGCQPIQKVLYHKL